MKRTARIAPGRSLLLALAVLAVPAGLAAEEPPKDLAQPPPEAEKTASGLVTLKLAAGELDERPDENDFVTIHYTGWTPAGARFESTYDTGKPAQFFVEQVFPGWREGVQLMTVGEKRRMWIPAHLTPAQANGPRGDVVFDVELLGLIPIPSPPAALMQAPPEAERTMFGVFSQVISKGGGRAYPEAGDGALVHYTLWNATGKLIDSSWQRARPTAFPFENVMPAFADCLRQMTEGEKRHIWIPESVHAGQWPGRPKGMLIFELELIRFMEGAFRPEGP